MLSDHEQKFIDKLPAAARARFTRLRAQADQFTSAARDRSHRRVELLQEIEAQENWLARFVVGQAYRESEPAAVIAREEIKTKRAELADIDAVMQAADERGRELLELVRRVIDFLQTVPAGKAVAESNRPAPTLRKSESLVAAIERCRAKTGELRAELEIVKAAPIPAELAKANARREIAQLAARGCPTVSAMIDHGQGIAWPQATLQIGSQFADGADTLAMMAWLFQDQLTAAIDREIDGAAADANALAPDDREAKLAKIEELILEAERDEVALIERAAVGGISVMPRAGVSVLALLGLSETLASMPAPAEPPYRSMDRAPRRPAGTEAPTHGNLMPATARRDEEVWQ